MAVKKLIEVALPLEAINAASAYEKMPGIGPHPRGLHLWWARRPLATTRAIIWASLVDDPSSHPELFPTEAEQVAERERLFSILSKLVIWQNSNDESILNEAKQEIKKSMGENIPPLIDPFAGGGAIPLEAQRLGLESYAQDLNPVAVAINKSMIEIPPLFNGTIAVNPDSLSRANISPWAGNSGLAEDVAYYGRWMLDEAKQRIGKHYPKVKIPGATNDEKTAVAWIWARNVKCPNPACNHRTPLIRSFNLATKAGRAFHIKCDANSDELKFYVAPGKSPVSGTITRSGATCLHCGAPIDLAYIRDAGSRGEIGRNLIATVVEGVRGKAYIAPDAIQEAAAEINLPDDAPETFLPEQALGFRIQAYGMKQHKELFTNRQLLAMTTFSSLVSEAQELAYRDALAAGYPNDDTGLNEKGSGAKAYGQAIGVYLAFAVDRMADFSNLLTGWSPSNEKVMHLFTKQTISMNWDYTEANVLGGSVGSFLTIIDYICSCIKTLPIGTKPGYAKQWDAQSDNGKRGMIVSTDPPYYDNIGYADLSDFFYIWLRKSLRDTYPQLFSTLLVPKVEELVANPFCESRGSDGARDFFEEGMYKAVKTMREYACDEVPVTIYYAFKQSETVTENSVETTASTGWETMLSAIIRSGFCITGTWPVRTEQSSRTRSLGSNALASSIVLVCRKRPDDAAPATRRDFVNTLKRELKPALDKLQTSNIAPVDMAQSAIGPGIGVYSRFSKVLDADGSEMTVRSALQIINQELDLYFSNQDSDLDRESRFCVDLYTQFAFNEMKFGEADVLARAKNTSIEGVASKGALYASKGIVRLLGRDEINMGRSDPNFRWLFTQQLAHAMETGGVEACANMLKGIYDMRAENAKALAYRLFTIADKKGWNVEAFAYNSLVVAWPEIQDRAAQLQAIEPEQIQMDFGEE